MPAVGVRIRGSASSRVSPGTPIRRIDAGILPISFGGQVEVLGLERRVALGVAAERVEVGGEVAVGAVGLEQRGRRLDRLQQLRVGTAAWIPVVGSVAAGIAPASASGGAEAEAGWAIETTAARSISSEVAIFS